MQATALHLLSEAFWNASKSVALTPGGIEAVTCNGVPAAHVLFATSGTSGAPKWIALGKSALLGSAAGVNAHLDVSRDSIWGLALPVHHVGGFGVVARARDAGCGLAIFPNAWDAAAFTVWLERERVTHTSAVPTQVHDLVAAKCPAPPCLRAVVVGGGRLDGATGQAARDLGWPVLASYGMTEAASQIATQPMQALAKPYTPTPIPVLPHWQVRTDEDGVLCIRGPALFSGTIVAGVYHPRPSKEYRTGDRVDLTNDGLVPIGRVDALVKIAGELIDPLAVESRLAAELGPHSRGLAIVAVPHPRIGTQLAAIVEASVPLPLLLEAITTYNATVPKSQRIGDPKIIDHLPRSPLGKTQRAQLG